MMPNTVINLLWTGGWDSTFRLLSLVLDKKLSVQPHYLIDSDRLSTRNELLTIRDIKQKLFLTYPFTQQLVLPNRIIEISDIKPDQEIYAAYQDIRSRLHVGTQYEWLARYCKEQKINEMEICSCVTPGTGSALIVAPYLEKVEKDGLAVYQMRADAFERPEGHLFKYFDFPLYTLTKLQMQTIALNNGWFELMNMTWFCHKPTRKQQPCGVCTPCQIAITEGLGWRIPKTRRIYGYIIKFLKKKIFGIL